MVRAASLIAPLAAFPACGAAAAAVAKTAFGDVLGVQQGHTLTWRGIPYATARRWEAPVDWQEPFPNGALEAKDYGPGCPQPPQEENVEAPESQDEDCLLLNIHSPVGAKRLPVLAFIHGGGFIQGAASPMYQGLFEYSGTGLAARNVVVAVLQYRLGALGWLPVNTTNAGLRDQQSALRWLQNHIQSFGGNPQEVTIFGQSAGGMSVVAHLVWPSSFGLFHRAIVESGPYDALGKDSASTTAFALSAGCLTRSCLDDVSVDVLLKAQSTMLFTGPSIDGDVLERDPLELVQQGKWARVPVVLGTASHEAYWGLIYDGTGSIWPSNKSMPSFAYRILLTGLALEKGADVLEVFKAYPAQQGNNINSFVAAATDAAFRCPTSRFAQALTEQHASVFLYHWDWRSLCAQWETFFPAHWEVSHSSELPFLFDYIKNCTLSEEDEVVQHAAQEFWASFASTGDPGCSTGVCWQTSPEAQAAMRVGDFASRKPVLRMESYGDHCEVWNAPSSSGGHGNLAVQV